MPGADLALQRLVEHATAHGAPELLDLSEAWTALEALDRELEVDAAEMTLSFSEAPTAYELAWILDETDREARRLVAALQRGVDANLLRGRGARLIPTRQGLVVRAAIPGSLDVALLLGGLYQAVISQPLSFALNLGALLGYTRASIRALSSRRKGPKVISVRLPQPADQESSGDAPHVGPPHGDILVNGYSSVKIRYQTADGTSLEIDCDA